MADRPILFSGPMVRALLEGRKTQTRRVIPAKLEEAYYDYAEWCSNVSPGIPTSRQWEREFFLERCRFAPGDVLWVREAWRNLQKWDCLAPRHLAEDRSKITYEADVEHRNPLWAFGKLRPSMFMPRWASRLTLIVESVKVERLQDISRGDAVLEGCPFANMAAGPDPRAWFQELWGSINGADSWKANPWVAAISFRVGCGNIDSDKWAAAGASEARP
jgi:hypothetical protein